MLNVLFDELKLFVTQPRTYFTQMKEQYRLRRAFWPIPFVLLTKMTYGAMITGEFYDVLRKGMGVAPNYFFHLLYVELPTGILFIVMWCALLHKIAQLLGGKGAFKSFFTCNLLIIVNLMLILCNFYFFTVFADALTLYLLIDLIHWTWGVILSVIVLHVCHELSLLKSIAAFVITFLAAFLLSLGIGIFFSLV